jgi:putative phosphoesterase
MRVAIVADTHSRSLPDACVRELRGADLILHAGDHSSLTAFEELRAFGPPVEAVHGNVDEPALRELLPRERKVELETVTIGLVHVPGPAAGREARLVARFPGCHAVVYGHTHRPQVERHGGVWILNPGSPTERRRSPDRTMIVLGVGGGGITPELISLGT